MTERQPTRGSGAELAVLSSFVEFHRATIELKCEGLTGDQLAERAVPPSELSLLGIVRHLADVERNWFRRRFEGLDPPTCFRTAEDPNADFRLADPAGVDEAFATWRAECAHGRSIAAAHGLEEIAAWRREGEEISLRWILLHLVEEYARHNGHADLLRERLDGVTGV